ncbi:hypothetical protein F0562_020916 [Nyssa sinensis]|uniref:Pectate lyase superfamily protein domain-containing protein n=1 Tax=Nyssa sinensis TaxID=561372 RepID=A0A5J5BVV5_9ASTE|nr:hypothetical protein F0562_020916 [Nyssa sinensis]
MVDFSVVSSQHNYEIQVTWWVGNLGWNRLGRMSLRGLECKNFKGSDINISAPSNSPNTVGIHIERSSSVYFSGSVIGTGDDCISVGQGNSQVTITSISCGPGHDISVGSLGRYPNEGDVSGFVIRDCTMTGTTHGIRIKTWPNSPGWSIATNMTFENIVMNNVDQSNHN